MDHTAWEVVAAVGGVLATLISGMNFWMVLTTKLAISEVKNWTQENFVRKRDFLDTLSLWDNTSVNHNRRETRSNGR